MTVSTTSSVESPARSTSTTAASSSTAGGGGHGSVREKARRRWEQRAAQRWRHHAKITAVRRPHEEAAHDEHERLLVEKARLKQIARMKEQKHQQMQKNQQQRRGSDNAMEPAASDDFGARGSSTNGEQEQEEAVMRAKQRRKAKQQKQQHSQKQRSQSSQRDAHDASPSGRIRRSTNASSSSPVASGRPPLATSPDAGIRPNSSRTQSRTAAAATDAAPTSSATRARRNAVAAGNTDHADGGTTRRTGTSTSTASTSTSTSTPQMINQSSLTSTSAAFDEELQSTMARQLLNVTAISEDSYGSGPTNSSSADGSVVIDKECTASSAAASAPTSTATDVDAASKMFRRSAISAVARSRSQERQRPHHHHHHQQQQQQQQQDRAPSAVGAYSATGLRDVLTGRLKQSIVDRHNYKTTSRGGGGGAFQPVSSSSSSDIGIAAGVGRDALRSDELRALLGGRVGPNTRSSKKEEQQQHRPPANSCTRGERARGKADVDAVEGPTNTRKQVEPEEGDGSSRTRPLTDEEIRRANEEIDDFRRRGKGRRNSDGKKDPPDDDNSHTQNTSKADPPCTGDIQTRREEKTGGITFVKVAPAAAKQQPVSSRMPPLPPKRQQQRQQRLQPPQQEQKQQGEGVDVVKQAEEDVVNCGLQNLHHITEVRARERLDTHGTTSSRSIVSELTCDDHSSAAGHNSHFPTCPIQEEAGLLATVGEAALLHGHRTHQGVLPSVTEEISQPSLEMNLTSSRPSEATTICETTVATKKPVDSSLSQILKEAQDLQERMEESGIEDSALDISSVREDENSENVDPAIKREMEELLTSIGYTESQLSAAQTDVRRQNEIQESLVAEVRELMQELGLSDPDATREIEDEAEVVLCKEEEARIALVHSERECRWTGEDLANKTETEAALQSSLKELNAQLVDFEAMMNLEEIKLLERAEACKEEEKALQEEFDALKARLEEVAAYPPMNRGEVSVGVNSDDCTDVNVSMSTDGACSEPFDEQKKQTELSMIISEYIGDSEAAAVIGTGTPTASAPLASDAKVAIQEMQEMVSQFEKTIEELESKQGQVLSPIAPREVPRPPTLPRLVPSPTWESASSDDGDTEKLPNIISMSSPLKEEKDEIPAKVATGKPPRTPTRKKKPDARKLNQSNFTAETTRELTVTGDAVTKGASFDTSKDLSEEGFPDLRQFLTPGTPKRMATKKWKESPKRALNLSSSFIDLSGRDLDTVSSIGSKEPLVLKSAPETPQRYSKIAQKCHETCGVVDMLYTMPFWNKGIPEEEEVTKEKL